MISHSRERTSSNEIKSVREKDDEGENDFLSRLALICRSFKEENKRLLIITGATLIQYRWAQDKIIGEEKKES